MKSTNQRAWDTIIYGSHLPGSPRRLSWAAVAGSAGGTQRRIGDDGRRADETTPEGPETRNLGKLGWVQSEPPKITKLICNSNIYVYCNYL